MEIDGSLEVRIQEHQVYRPHRTDGEDADQPLDGCGPKGVWILRERQPGSGSPPLVTEKGTTIGILVQENRYSDVYRL